MRVAARTSSFAFKGKDTRVKEIGELLGVAHVLEGSVRKAGSHIRITAQLIETATGFHLWSETYDRTLDDIFAIQDEASWLTLTSYLAACVAGFLIWNWSPAKIFMGDACSGFLGFTLGIVMIVTSAEGAVSLWVWAILSGVFLVDATTTLVRRIYRKD